MLTESNYFGPEAGHKYMSTSQLKRFLQCEALAYAELNGMYERETTTALLVGGYVDAYFSNTVGQYVAEHPQIYTQKGAMRAEFSQAQEIIERIELDELMSAMINGEQQRIVTGEIQGVPFRGKLDSLLDEKTCKRIMAVWPGMTDTLLMANGAIVDLKVMRDLNPIWVEGKGRVSFIEAWKYDLQCAIYQHLIGGKLPCFIACATKEKVPDLALIHIPQYMLDAALETNTADLKRFQAIKDGQIEPIRCEQCDWCRKTRVITGPVDADELGGVE